MSDETNESGFSGINVGGLVDNSPQRDATSEELALYSQAQEKIEQLDTSGNYDASDPNHYLFVIAFDGTTNDRLDTSKNRSNPDLLESMVPRDENDNG